MTSKARTVAPTATAVRLLGPPRIERDGEPVRVDTRKAIALLAYLALSGRPASRDSVAALLWPEADQTRARAALRRTLSVLNSALDGRGLRIEREALALEAGSVWVDVVEFRRLVAQGDVSSLRAAVDLYRGELLSGFALRDSAEFDEWQLTTSEGFRTEVASALERLTDEFAESDIDVAISYARRWLELDPLSESAHRWLIRLHTRKGDRAAAVRQYRDCVALLERELGVPPGAETTEVYEAARAGAAAAVEQPQTASLHQLMGDLLTLQGRYGEAQGNYEIAIARGAPAGEVRRKLADIYQRLGSYDAADRLYGEALDDLDPTDAGERARLLADRSLNAHRCGRAADADELAGRALAEAQKADDPRALAQAHNLLGIISSHRGDAETARTNLERSIDLAQKLDDPVATAAALNNLALVLQGSGELEPALGLAQRALDLCVRVGDRHREAAMHSNLADILRAAGRKEEAMRHLRMSAAIFAEVGEPDELRPEIWKLVEW